MKLTLGFSPCPNDTYLFDALVHGKIDTEGLEFEVVLGDVEDLNQRAFKHQLDVTKLSYFAFAHLIHHYVLLDSGSALGRNCGPILVAKGNHRLAQKISAAIRNPMENAQALKCYIDSAKIGIPGNFTTANFLFSLAFPEAKNKTELLFSDIEKNVQNNEIDAGLLIHENRFTYQERGFVKLIDLGEFWEFMMNAPIPLGGIVVKRELSQAVKLKINRVLRRSVDFAVANPTSSLEYVKKHAQEMEEDILYKHIALYVNEFTISLGKEGRRAVELLFSKAQNVNLIPEAEYSIFI